MTYIKSVVILTITIGGILLLSTHQPLGTSIPAMGNVLSPFSGFWQNAENTAAPSTTKITASQLADKGEVVFDERLVPHIFANNTLDAIFIQGYITARYRLWQMDISVRGTAGFLSEILGEKTLVYDIKKRRKGMLFAAEQTVRRWEQTGEIEIINRYCAGINAWIQQLSPKDYPIEYKLMGYQPSEWTPLKSAIFLKGMTETLASGNTDLRASNALKTFEPELFNFLYPSRDPQSAPVIPEGTIWDFIPDIQDSIGHSGLSQIKSAHLPPYEFWPPTPDIVGSNNWAVAGSKTKSGRPILCNDPHLPLSLPSIWYEVQIATPEYNAYGVSLPGLPGMAIGFNENIAWGVTNGGIDVLDWYTIQWANEIKTQYIVDEQIHDVSIRKEVIPVKGQEDHIEEVKYTRWGPIVHEETDSPYLDMAMHWIALEAPADKKKSAISTFLGLMKSKNYKDYRKALSYYDSPIQNFAFACKDGDIAITVNGKIPIRKPSAGRFIQEGNTSQNEWQGYIPMEQAPHVLNPERGFVSSANQYSTPPDYPYPILGRFASYRARRINEKLAQMQNIEPSDMMKMQNETYSLKAKEALPLLLKSQTQDSTSQIIRDLKAWNLSFDKDSRSAVIFEEWARQIYRMTFDEVYELRDSMSILFPASWRLIELLETAPNHPIFDNKETAPIENAADIIQSAYNRVKSKFEPVYHEDSFNWTNHQNTHINHLGQIAAFSANNIKTGGHYNSINAVQDDFGPSWRMIVALGDKPEAWGVYPGGQSGNPGSKYYDNMIQQWTNGTYNQLFFMESGDDDKQGVLFRLFFEKTKS